MIHWLERRKDGWRWKVIETVAWWKCRLSQIQLSKELREQMNNSKIEADSPWVNQRRRKKKINGREKWKSTHTKIRRLMLEIKGLFGFFFFFVFLFFFFETQTMRTRLVRLSLRSPRAKLEQIFSGQRFRSRAWTMPSMYCLSFYRYIYILYKCIM